jgi:hypothetical protein
MGTIMESKTTGIELTTMVEHHHNHTQILEADNRNRVFVCKGGR